MEEGTPRGPLTMADALKLVRPVRGGNVEEFSDPEDYQDFDEPDVEETVGAPPVAGEKPEGAEEGEEKPQDLRAAFIRAQAEIQHLKQTAGRQVPQEPATPEDWVGEDPKARGALGEDGRATREQVDAYWASRDLIREMKLARIEMDQQAPIAIGMLDVFSDAGFSHDFNNAEGYRQALLTAEEHFAEIINALVEAEVAEAMKDVQQQWGVGKLHAAGPGAPKLKGQELVAYKQALTDTAKDHSPQNVQRMLRARRQLYQK